MDCKTSIDFLNSCSTKGSVWGNESRLKWTGAWWHMAVLVEMGLMDRVPQSALVCALEQLKVNTVPYFIYQELEYEGDKMTCCHCELATFAIILDACGIDVDTELPWIRSWLLKAQLPDGGLNCESEAYAHSHKSSLVSTLPPLEFVLHHTHRPFTPEEVQFLASGASYLVEHRLVRSIRTREILNSSWLKPCFPRFFEYDILRGLHFLAAWSQNFGTLIPSELIAESVELMRPYIKSGTVSIGRLVYGVEYDWPEPTFELLDSVSKLGRVSPYLTEQLKVIAISFKL